MNPAAPLAVAAGTPLPASIGGMLSGLALVLGLIVVLAWLVRRLTRLGANGGQNLLRVRASIALGVKERLLLVDAAGECLLLGVTPNGVACLHRYAEAPPETAAAPGNFVHFLQNARRRRDDDHAR